VGKRSDVEWVLKGIGFFEQESVKGRSVYPAFARAVRAEALREAAAFIRTTVRAKNMGETEAADRIERDEME
jgi:hypothetical protein